MTQYTPSDDVLSELRAFAEQELEGIHLLPVGLRPHMRGMRIMKMVERAQAVLSARLAEARIEALTDARRVITQYLATAETWRYDRVARAFAVILGEIPEDTPEPLSPADEAELARPADRIAREATQ